MRDVLIHDYIGVDLGAVWNVASSRIPELQAVLEQFLAAGEGAKSTQLPWRAAGTSRNRVLLIEGLWLASARSHFSL